VRGDARDKFVEISRLSLGLNEKGQNRRLPGREYPVNVRTRDRVPAATDSSENLATDTDVTLKPVPGMSMWNISCGS